jgi:hypothetical protein
MAQYRCTNFGNCGKADSYEAIEASEHEACCPECKSTLIRNGKPPNAWGISVSGRKPLTILATISAIITIVIIINSFFSETTFSVVITSPNAEQGKVVSDKSEKDKEIDCGSACTQKYPANTSVILIAQANKNFSFSRWTGDCEKFATKNECTLTMDSDKKIGAIFKQDIPPPPPPEDDKATIKILLYGEGVVTSEDGKINCASRICTQEYLKNTEIVLTAKEKDGYKLRQWGEACEQTENDKCTIKLDANKSAMVFFENIDEGRGVSPDVNRQLKEAMKRCSQPPDKNCMEEMIKAIDSGS